jgi:O-antigen/teichoic acid export membrane protein
VTVRPLASLRALGSTKKSALWMVVRGASIALTTLGLSVSLGLFASKPLFDAWALLAGLVAWLNLVEIGFSSSVVRFVSENPDAYTQGRVVHIVQRLLRIPAAMSIVIFAGLAASLQWLYPAVGRTPRIQMALFITAMFSAVSLTLSPSIYFFVGRLETRLVALNSVVVRVAQLVAVLVGAVVTKNLVVMGLGFGVPPFVGGLYMRARSGRVSSPPSGTADLNAERHPDTRDLKARVMQHTSAAAIWTLSSAFISNLDIPLVGRFAPGAIGEYNVCLAAGLLGAGLHAAVLSPIVPRVASLGDRFSEIADWTLSAAKRTNLAMGVWTGGLIAGALLVEPLLHFADRRRFIHIIVLLSCAQLCRILGGPYSAALLGTGEHRRVVLSPILEALANVVASVLLGHRYGAVGVAAGTLVGAVVSLALHVLYNMNRTPRVPVNPRRYVVSAVIPAFCIVAPVGVAAWLLVM